MRSLVRIPVGESGAGPEVAVRRSAARRPGLIMRASLPTEPKRCERRARYTPARFNMASAPTALHRRHADLTGVRPRGGRRDARAFQRQAHRRGLRRTRPATRRRGHEEDGVSSERRRTRSTCEASRSTQRRPGGLPENWRPEAAAWSRGAHAVQGSKKRSSGRRRRRRRRKK
jgi:hypothetical protein